MSSQERGAEPQLQEIIVAGIIGYMSRPHSLQKIFDRDSGICQYCGVLCHMPKWRVRTPEEATVDHVIPKIRGGTDALTNLALACKKCNMEKGDAIWPLRAASSNG